MGLLDNANMVDAKRLEAISHASVTRSGCLRFSTDAMDTMGLAGARSTMLFSLADRRRPNGDVEHGAVARPGGAERFA